MGSAIYRSSNSSRLINLLIIIFVCFLSFIRPSYSSSERSEDIEPDTYFSPTLQIRIAHRPGWKIEQQGQTLILSPSSIAGVSIRLQRSENQKVSLAELWKTPQNPDKRRVFTSLKGLKALREETTGTQSGLYDDHYIAVRDNALYTIDLSASRQNLKIVKPAFDAVLASIEWTDAQGHVVSYAPPPGETLDQLRKRAEAGDKKAQLDLGAKYHFGQEVPKDEAEAMKWFQKSADQGYDKAYYNLGVIYMNGEGVPVDTAKASDYFRKSAEAGYPRAQLLMGNFCEQGGVVPRDIGQAKQWYQKAANAGVPEAITALKQVGSPLNSWRERLAPLFGIYFTAMPTDMLLSVIAGYLIWPLAIGSLLLFGILVTLKRRWNKPNVGALLFVLPGIYAGMYFLGLILGGSVVYWSGAFYGLAGGLLGYIFGWSLFLLFQSRIAAPSVSIKSYEGRRPFAVWMLGIFLLSVTGSYFYYRYRIHLWEKIWSQTTSPSEYVAIANNVLVQHSHDLANELGRNPRTPIEALMILRGTPVWKDVEGCVARRGDVPQDLATEIMKSSDIVLRRNMAQNPKLSPDTARQLAAENDVEIRMGLIQNPATPIDLLEQMAQSDPVSKPWIEGYIKNRKLALEDHRN
jgi:Sel1 repeat